MVNCTDLDKEVICRSRRVCSCDWDSADDRCKYNLAFTYRKKKCNKLVVKGGMRLKHRTNKKHRTKKRNRTKKEIELKKYKKYTKQTNVKVVELVNI